MNSDILVYDMEVYKHDWFITIRSLSTNTYTQLHNDLDTLKKFYDAHKTDIWAGHNITHYDNIILKALLLGYTGSALKDISNEIIINDMGYTIAKKLKLNKITLYSLDVMQDAIRYSLKEVEGYLGMSIEETEIPFDIDRALTSKEVELVFRYNKHDVDATTEEILLRLNRLLNKLNLLSEYNLPLSMLEYTNAKLCSQILDANYTTFTDGLQPYDISIAPIEIHKYAATIDFFTKCKSLDYNRKLEINIANVPHVLANGGIHGAIENFYYTGELWLIDVSSYYPNIMINFNLCSRAMSHPENFSNLVRTRMIAKENKEKYKQLLKAETDKRKIEEYTAALKKYSSQSDALKLPINTTSGAMKAKFSKLFDERNNNWMCITGQLLLVDLIESLEPYCKLVQSNTDGIIIIPENKEKCDEKIQYWEHKTGLILEKTIASKIYQKDVNNYILLDSKGHVKTKGGYVAQYHNEERYSDMLRRNLEILDDAIVDFLLFDKPLEDTIINSAAPLLKYQIIKKLGAMYTDVAQQLYIDGSNECVLETLSNRVNRVIATSNKLYGKIIKRHYKKATYDDVEGCPDNCLLVNYDIRNLTSKDVPLDYDWYINLAKKRIIDFILTDAEKKESKINSLDVLWHLVLSKLGKRKKISIKAIKTIYF